MKTDYLATFQGKITAVELEWHTIPSTIFCSIISSSLEINKVEMNNTSFSLKEFLVQWKGDEEWGWCKDMGLVKERQNT